MIIKSMSRKDATFAQLVTYICRDHAADQRFALTHNILAKTQAGITTELEQNGRLLKTRKNGVVLYHEVISITRGKALSEDAQKQALRKIALDYVKQRAPKCLAYGMLHSDHKDHLHYHLVISANEHGQSKRHSLTKAQFRGIQIGLEQRVLTQQPLLEQKLAIGRRAAHRQSQAGVEVERRLGKKPQVNALKDRIAAVFTAARNPEEAFKLLTDQHLEFYQRGKTVGIRDLDKCRNHRLDTLGLADAFKAMSQRFETHLTNQHAATPGAAMKPPVDIQAPAPRSRLVRAGIVAAKGAEKVMGTVATRGGQAVEAVVGGGIKHTVGSMEIAVHTLGGPKPHEQQKAQQQAAAPVPQPVQEPATKENKTTAPLNTESEIDRLMRERLAEMEAVREEQFKQQLKRENMPGPRLTR